MGKEKYSPEAICKLVSNLMTPLLWAGVFGWRWQSGGIGVGSFDGRGGERQALAIKEMRTLKNNAPRQTDTGMPNDIIVTIEITMLTTTKQRQQQQWQEHQNNDSNQKDHNNDNSNIHKSHNKKHDYPGKPVGVCNMGRL